MRVAAHACRCIIALYHARGVGEEMQAIQQKPKEPETSGVKRTLTLFCILFKIGLFSFGGGWSIIAQMETEFIQKRHWITQEELLDQGIKPNTIRLSIGTENIDDIIQDLDEAFKAVE